MREYAKWLGMELKDDLDLFWIAKEGLKAPLPENWKPCKTVDTDEIYYFNFATGEPLMLYITAKKGASRECKTATLRQRQNKLHTKNVSYFFCRRQEDILRHPFALVASHRQHVHSTILSPFNWMVYI